MSNGNLALVNDGAVMLTDERVDLLSRTIANGAPPLEFELFVQICNRTGLDPFAKQIYFIQRGGKWSPQTSIDGYRLIAERTGLYAGSDEPVYDSEDGDHPGKASVTVWKMVGGQRVPFSASARWSEYRQETSPMWKKMPYLMLGKCAESLALRKAFPQELSGLYTKEEMDQAGPYIEASGVTVDAGTGEIMDSSTADLVAAWQPVIDAAESLDDLAEVAAGMKEAGVKSENHPELLRIFKARMNNLKIEAAKVNRAAQETAERAKASAA
jgi:phage recombination protein Bet